ncbi:MAG: peptidase E [Planctomycetes bacterium]|nr:peptidase E [Planctomycetota bacterium]
MKIMAIGGGGMKGRKVRGIEARLAELTGKRRPTALFIPTASGDNPEYTERFHRFYGGAMGCRTEALELFRNRPSGRRIEEIITNADLIYVGGGNTYRMIKLWRKLGVDRMLRKAGERGTVLSGASAGAICWYRHGHSDSRYKPDRAWDYIRVGGLGFLKGMYCPHYHSEKREASFHAMVLRYGGVWIACDDDAAIETAGDGYRIVTSRRGAKAYRVYGSRGEIVRERLNETKKHLPLEELLKKP